MFSIFSQKYGKYGKYGKKLKVGEKKKKILSVSIVGMRPKRSVVRAAILLHDI